MEHGGSNQSLDLNRGIGDSEGPSDCRSYPAGNIELAANLCLSLLAMVTEIVGKVDL